MKKKWKNPNEYGNAVIYGLYARGYGTGLVAEVCGRLFLVLPDGTMVGGTHLSGGNTTPRHLSESVYRLDYYVGGTHVRSQDCHGLPAVLNVAKGWPEAKPEAN